MKSLMSNKTAAKRTACILTAGMMALSTGLFTACGDKNQGGGSNSAVVDQSEALKTLAYKVTDVPVNIALSIDNVAVEISVVVIIFLSNYLGKIDRAYHISCAVVGVKGVGAFTVALVIVLVI